MPKPNLLQASTTAILIYFVLSLKKNSVVLFTYQPESSEIGGILKIFPGEFEHKSFYHIHFSSCGDSLKYAILSECQHFCIQLLDNGLGSIFFKFMPVLNP